MTPLHQPEVWRSIEVFEFRGKPYILTEGVIAGATVSSIWNNEHFEWCTFDLRRQHEVMRYYDILPLPSPPAGDAN